MAPSLHRHCTVTAPSLQALARTEAAAAAEAHESLMLSSFDQGVAPTQLGQYNVHLQLFRPDHSREDRMHSTAEGWEWLQGQLPSWNR